MTGQCEVCGARGVELCPSTVAGGVVCRECHLGTPVPPFEVTGRAPRARYRGRERAVHIGRLVAEDVAAYRPLASSMRDALWINAVGFRSAVAGGEGPGAGDRGAASGGGR